MKNGSALGKNQGITYIMLSEDSTTMIGYYHIEVGRADQIEIVAGKEYYKRMGGSVTINYLAIHSKYLKTKIAEIDDKRVYWGDYLLRDCEKKILELRNNVGISFVTICSTKQGYHLYHERNGYEVFDNDMKNYVTNYISGWTKLLNKRHIRQRIPGMPYFFADRYDSR